MADKHTAPSIRGMKAKGERVVCLTAYDAITGGLADQAGADLILVGDSVGNTLLGHETTVPVTLEAMCHHVRAARTGVSRALLAADMPFGTYGASVSQAVESAVLLARAGAAAVKLEGDFAAEIEAIVKIGLPVVGHVGMTPQSVHKFGGFRIQGRGDKGQAVLDAARSIEDAGAFSIVLELIPGELAARITEALEIPTIGIGAGPDCDGEIQVIFDLLGFAPHMFKHTKRYLEGGQLAQAALETYVAEVRKREFPARDQMA